MADGWHPIGGTAGGASGGVLAVKEDGVQVVADASVLDFLDAFDIVDAGSNVASIYNKLQDFTGGRLSLESGVPVSTTSQSAKTTIYYVPYINGLLSLYDGTRWRPFTFATPSVAVPATTVTPYDIFAYANGTTVTLETVNWTNDTTRATALTYQDGRLVKTGAVTRRYLGTGRTTGTSGQCEFSFGGTAAGGTEAKLYLWNMYNRVDVTAFISDSTNSWTYQTASTWRSANASATMRASYIHGLSEDSIFAQYISLFAVGASSDGFVGIGIDSTSVASGTGSYVYGFPGSAICGFALYGGLPGVGYHYIQALENIVINTNPVTFYGDNGDATLYKTGLLFVGKF